MLSDAYDTSNQDEDHSILERILREFKSFCGSLRERLPLPQPTHLLPPERQQRKLPDQKNKATAQRNQHESPFRNVNS
jgi:hypothetical protein